MGYQTTYFGSERTEQKVSQLCLCECPPKTDGYGTLASIHRVKYMHHTSHMVVVLLLYCQLLFCHNFKLLSVFARLAAVWGESGFLLHADSELFLAMAEYCCLSGKLCWLQEL